MVAASERTDRKEHLPTNKPAIVSAQEWEAAWEKTAGEVLPLPDSYATVDRY